MTSEARSTKSHEIRRASLVFLSCGFVDCVIVLLFQHPAGAGVCLSHLVFWNVERSHALIRVRKSTTGLESQCVRIESKVNLDSAAQLGI